MNKFIKFLSAILCGVGALFAVSKVNAYTITEKYGYNTIISNNVCNIQDYTSTNVDVNNNDIILSGSTGFNWVPLSKPIDTSRTIYVQLFGSGDLNQVEIQLAHAYADYDNRYGIMAYDTMYTLNLNWDVNYLFIYNQSGNLNNLNVMVSYSPITNYEPYGEYIDINAYEKVISGYLTTASNIYWSNTWASENYITSYPMYVNESVSNDNYDAPSLIDSINNSQLVLKDFQPYVSSDISSNHIVVNGAGFGSCTYLFDELSSINLISFTTFAYNQNNSLTNASAFYFEYNYNNTVGSVNLTYGDLITKYNFNYSANNLFEYSFYQLIVDNLGYEPSAIPVITRFSYSYDSLSNAYGFGYFNMLNVNGYSQGYESGYSTASSDKQRIIDNLQNAYDDLSNAYNSLNTRFKSLQELYDSYINDNVTLDALIWNIATTPFETFKTIWDVDILGVNLGSLCVGLMFVGIALYIWRKFI